MTPNEEFFHVSIGTLRLCVGAFPNSGRVSLNIRLAESGIDAHFSAKVGEVPALIDALQKAITHAGAVQIRSGRRHDG